MLSYGLTLTGTHYNLHVCIYFRIFCWKSCCDFVDHAHDVPSTLKGNGFQLCKFLITFSFTFRFCSLLFCKEEVPHIKRNRHIL